MKPFKLLFIGLLLCKAQMGFTQKTDHIKLQTNNNIGFHVVNKNRDGFKAKSNLKQVKLIERETPRGIFKELEANGFQKSFRKGYPGLPVKTRLVQIPAGTTIRVKVNGYDEETIDLNGTGLSQKLMPAQPSIPKGKDRKRFYYNERIYQTNKFLGGDVVQVKEIGIMRNIKLGRLEISPFQYNPVENKLRIINNLEFTLTYEKTDRVVKPKPGKNLSNSFFRSVENSTINKNAEANNKKPAGNGPLTYVIISPPEFQKQLEPLVRWKNKKGFHVVEGYTDSIGSTRTEIKAFLKDLYVNPGVSSPSFLLLVGDVEQIPSWEGKTGGSHVTDLYYAEYTGDYLPELYYGRFPAADTAQLRIMISKTLKYEKYELTDPSYLKHALLVAGNDESYEDTYANGQVNYGTRYYFNDDNGITPHAFLQDPPDGNTAVHDSIIHNMNQGLGFATYTAHCLSNGWSNPGFNLDDISALTVNDKYGLWISNCCESLKFDRAECFGEAALRAGGKGAIGAIGATDDTYWDEDYWWGIGVTGSILSNPTYEDSDLGLYDRMFHTHGEDISEWYITQGQMVAAGNLAVEASTSNLKDYYWEVYHLLGDPSLMPYLGMPSTLSVSHNPQHFTIGMDTLTIQTRPYAYVAFSYAGELLDAGMADNTGIVGLAFPELQQPGKAELVVTAQNSQPYVETAYVAPLQQPYVVLEDVTIQDSSGNGNGSVDFGETVSLNILLKNVNDSFAAYGVTDSLYTNDPHVQISKNLQAFGHIKADSLVEKQGSFKFTVSDSVTDQYRVKFDMDIRGKDAQDSIYVWHSQTRFTIGAPLLRIGDMILDDGPAGNDSLDPGETVALKVVVHNDGHASLAQSTVFLEMKRQNDYLSLDDSLSSTGVLEANGADTVSFTLTADSESPDGMPLYLNISAVGGANNQYTTSTTRRIILGKTPIYRINETNTIQTFYGLFYDSGGPNNNYSNNESHKQTFKPAKKGQRIKAEFKSFNVEANYDYLKVYDGSSTADTLLGEYDNEHKPGLFEANNDSGALTFEFSSDASITRSGWEAEIISLPRDTVVFNITNDKTPVEGARVVIQNDTLLTGPNGQVLFVLDEGTYQYSIRKEGYYTRNGSFEVYGNMNQTFILEKIVYDIAFNLLQMNSKASLDGTVILNDSTTEARGGFCSFKNIWSMGIHSYQVHVEGHQPASGEIRLDSDTTITVLLQLTEYPVSISVTDDHDLPLDSVKVLLDTMETYTGANGKVEFSYPYGDYLLKLHKSQYVSHNSGLQISDTTSLEIPLKRLHRIQFNVMSESDHHTVRAAIIHIDTKELHTDTSGRALVELTAGKYEYSVEASSYKTYQHTMNVTEDSLVDVVLLPSKTSSEKLEAEDIMLFPNPTDGIFRIRNETGYRKIVIRIYNLTGNLIYNEVMIKPYYSVDLTNYPEGIYLIELNMEGAVITRKLLLK